MNTKNTMRLGLLTATIVAIGYGAAARAEDDVQVLGAQAAQNVAQQMQTRGGARLYVGDERDTSGRVLRRYYRDVLGINGTATSDAGQLKAMAVRLGPEKYVDATPVYQYPIYYWNPTQRQWVAYCNVTDAAQATRIVQWLQSTYHVYTYCQGQLYNYTFVEPAVVRPTTSSTATASDNPSGGVTLLGITSGQ